MSDVFELCDQEPSLEPLGNMSIKGKVAVSGAKTSLRKQTVPAVPSNRLNGRSG